VLPKGKIQEKDLGINQDNKSIWLLLRNIKLIWTAIKLQQSVPIWVNQIKYLYKHRVLWVTLPKSFAISRDTTLQWTRPDWSLSWVRNRNTGVATRTTIKAFRPLIPLKNVSREKADKARCRISWAWPTVLAKNLRGGPTRRGAKNLFCSGPRYPTRAVAWWEKIMCTIT
jgi:hypothetical protein